MRAAIWFLWCVIVLGLVACGGGSSSGAGSASRYAGTYNGFGTLDVSGPGGSETVSGTIQIVISPQGNVVSDPGTPFAGTGSLDGNRFSTAIPARYVNEPGLACTGAIIVSGTITGNTIDGTFTSSGLTCNGRSGQINGTFQATRSTATRAGTPLMESLRDAMH